jgi:hypothetical protein
MEGRELASKFKSSDIFCVKSGVTNGTSQLYDPHPFLKDQVNADNRTRTSFQDSNIFGYKQELNQTWQGTGRQERVAGIKTDNYHLASHTPGHTLYNPEAGLAMHKTHTKETFVEPEPEMYYHNDPRVPKSRLGEEIFGVRDFDRQAAKKDLLPNDDHWLRFVEKKKPTAEEEQFTPTQRKLNMLYGTYHGEGPIAFEHQEKELKHETRADWRNPHHGEKRSNVIEEVNTFSKRAQELSSVNNPLTTTDYSEYTPKTKAKDSYEDVEKRVKDAMYSDLYGQTSHYVEKPRVAKRSEVNSMTGIFSKEGADKGYRWGEDVTAAERRQDFMRTTAFPNAYDAVAATKSYPKHHEINEARSQLRMPKVIKGCELESTSLHSDEFYKKYNVIKDHRETNVISLRFKDLSPDMDADALRAMSGCKHVVRASVKADNIKNECTGEGEITIRLSEGDTKEDIISRFRAAGFTAEDKPDNAGQRKSNYHELASTGWRDSRLEFEEKRHINTGYENQRISKVNQLSTHVPMGSNMALQDYGVQYADIVRQQQDGLYQAQRTAIDENQLISTWDAMKPQTAASVRPASGTAFMRPTQSFNTRSKHVQDSLKNRGY